MGWIEYANYRQRRVEAGASVVREVGRSAITAMRRSASAKKVAFSDALMESIFEDIERGEPGGSYYLDGQRAVRGYAVGGYEGGGASGAPRSSPCPPTTSKTRKTCAPSSSLWTRRRAA